MAKKYEWDNYLIIESEFIEAKKYLSFERQKNYEADSPFLHNEIVLLGSQVETAMKKLISYENPDKQFSPGNMTQNRGRSVADPVDDKLIEWLRRNPEIARELRIRGGLD